ncbi:MAG: glutamine amidotransferase-related protein [Bacillota bacterium]
MGENYLEKFCSDVKKISAPVLSIVPRLDETITNLRPVLAWNNSEGGEGKRTYTLQIDTTPDFNSPNLTECRDIPEKIHVTSWRPKKNMKLHDNLQYFWRVLAVDGKGNSSNWGCEIGGVTARFFVQSTYNEKFYGIRVPAVKITSSHGYGLENIQDYDEYGTNYWEGVGNEEHYWIEFELEKPVEVSRIWLLCGMAGWQGKKNEQYDYINRSIDLSGRLSNYLWLYSIDGEEWEDIPSARVEGSNAFRADIVLDNNPVFARFFKLYITGWIGPVPRVHEVTFYTRSQPPVPVVENDPYVLVIGTRCSDQKNQNTDLRAAILGLNGHVAPPWSLKVVEIPAYKISLDLLNKMNPQPVAIFLTGSDRWGEMLPRFEYNGVFEIIRHTDIPILGVCNGHQLLAQQEGITFAKSIGRSYCTKDIESLIKGNIPPITIEKNDLIFSGMSNPFYGPQYHSWSIEVVPTGFEVLATSQDSDGVVCIEVIKARNKLIYGTQFHPEIPHPWNMAKIILINFLNIATRQITETSKNNQ